MIWILAAQLAMPMGATVTDVRALFTADDMPDYVMKEGVSRFVTTRTTVRPDGSIQDCSVERSSGNVKLDAYTCALVIKRSKLQAATWIDGTPAYGVIRMPVIWSVGGPSTEAERRKAFPADMELFVNRLPDGAGKSTSVRVMVATDERGKILKCEEDPSSYKMVPLRSFPQLVPVACQQISGQFTAPPVKDASGSPVHAVQTVSVAFTIPN